MERKEAGIEEIDSGKKVNVIEAKGCPLKCGVRDLPGNKESLISHFISFCS